MRALHGFTVMVPSDETMAAWATRVAAQLQGPVYIRVGRAKSPKVYEPGTTFEIGRANEVVEGSDLTIIANGVLVAAAIEAADLLAADGVAARVLDMHTVEPLDGSAVELAAEQTGAIVVAEEHFLAGGTGEAVARAVAETRPVPIEFVGVRDYGISGEPAELLAHYHLGAIDIVHAAQKALKRKRARS
jgi:transketolase